MPVKNLYISKKKNVSKFCDEQETGKMKMVSNHNTVKAK